MQLAKLYFNSEPPNINIILNNRLNRIIYNKDELRGEFVGTNKDQDMSKIFNEVNILKKKKLVRKNFIVY